MPKPPLPPDLVAFLAEPNPSVIATLRTDGSPHTAATWYLWVDGRVLVNTTPDMPTLSATGAGSAPGSR